MSEIDAQALIARIERLEARNQRLRQLGPLGIALLLVATAIAADQLVRRDGPVRAKKLAVHELVLEDETGLTRATLSADTEGARLRLYDGQGKRRASLAVGPDGEPGIAFFDAEEKNRAVLEIAEQGSRIALVDATGRTVFSRP